ncbi:MAG: hypothetical protein Q4F23_06890, partial [Coriobacteriia bacterium]|nr:hypothetical protein [Coriobacteriia bacterium]
GFTMRAKPRAEVLKSSFRRLLIPYFIVCGILLFFALVPPSSLNSSLDTQRSLPVVLVEAFYASGQEGQIAGHTFQAIGAIWFLPCLFWGRLVLNEILLRTAGLKDSNRLAEPALVLLVLFVGFAIGSEVRLPFDLDTAFVAVFFMYVGVLAHRWDLARVKPWQWCLIIAVWLLYLVAGSNEMAVRAYLEHPASLITASAGSLAVMGACRVVERLPLPWLKQGHACPGALLVCPAICPGGRGHHRCGGAQQGRPCQSCQAEGTWVVSWLPLECDIAWCVSAGEWPPGLRRSGALGSGRNRRERR